MKKKLNLNLKSTNKLKYPEQKLLNDNLVYSELSSILKRFYDSFSKYIQSMRNCLKEINGNIVNNKSISLDESSNKCISSLNIIFSYLDSSFNQFYSNIQKFSEQINNIEYSNFSYSSKKPNLSKNFSSQFYNDSDKQNTIYNNYQDNKIENSKNLYKKYNMSKMNTTSDLKNNNNGIEDKFGCLRSGNDLNNSLNNYNLIGGKFVDINFIENVKNLLNIIKYEKISDIAINRKSKYQQKLDNFKEKLITELSNEINDKNEKDIKPSHRRIKSVNLNSNSFNYFNNINKENDKINELTIQENDEKNLSILKEDINYKDKNKTTEKKVSLYYLENNIIDDINDNDIINNKVQTENDKFKNNNENSENNKKELLFQIAELITKNNSLTEEISLLKKSNIKKDEIENASNTKIKELNNKIESIMNSKNDVEKKNKELKKNIDIYQNEKESQLKEIKKLKDNIDNLKKENKTIKELKLEIDDLNREISELIKENQKLTNDFEDINLRKEEYKEKYKQTIKELSDEKEMNNIMEQKVKKLERKLEEYNINEYDEGKTKTYKLSNINKVNEIEVEKLNRKYVSPYNYRKNTSAFSTNNTSNNRKILINNNIDDLEITPENYVIVKYFQLNNKLKWYLLKKNKKQISEQEPSPMPSPSQSNSKQIFRRYKYLKINSKLNNERAEENYDNYIWKPSKNERDFINFNYLNEDNTYNNNNNKKENSISKDWQKKINELESCIKDLEEKLEKKENDCNRINLNYAKLFKRSKNPELNYDKLLENNENLKNENLILKNRIDNLKSTQNFIGLSFIEDDLEGSRFIDDNCFEDILDGLVGNNSRKTSTYKRNRDKDENKYEGNMLKFFRSHNDDNDNKENNDENKLNLNDNNKEDININNNNNKQIVEKKEKKIHLFYKNDTNNDKFVKFDIKTENQNNLKEFNKQRTFKYETKNKNINMNENSNEKNEKINKNIINVQDEKKVLPSDNNKSDKNNDNQKSDNQPKENKKFSSYRFSRFKRRINDNNINNNINNKNENKYDTDLNEKKEIKDDNNEKNKEKMRRNYFKNESKKENLLKQNDNIDEQKSQEKKIYINRLTELINNNRKTEKEPENKNIYSNPRRIRKSYQKYIDINNETGIKNNDINNINNEEKNNVNLNKEEKRENKPYRSFKSMKIESEIKIDKGLQESSSQTNRICRARRFYKRKQDEIKSEIKE